MIEPTLPEEMPITCPACGHANVRTEAQIRSAGRFPCRSCGKPIEIDKPTLLRTIEDAIARMRASLKGKAH